MPKLSMTVFLLLGVAASSTAGQGTPDGGRLYQQECARCHENEMPGVFLDGVRGPATIQEMPADQVYEALLYFFMKRQAATLTKAEKRAIAEYVSGSEAGSLVPPIDQIPQSAYCAADTASASDPSSGARWSGWSPGLENNRFQTAAAAGLTVDQVSDLELKWAVGLPGSTVVSMQPAVAGGRVVIGTSVGLILRLEASSGCIDWVQEVDYGVRAAPVIGPGDEGEINVYVGDTNANFYALDFHSGDLQWRTTLDDHPDARITGAAALHDGRLYVPVASLEEGTAEWPAYECCTFRGSIVAVDAVTGTEIWKTYPITEEPQRTGATSSGVPQWGPSGAGIWGTPTLDPERNTLYIATGDSYSDPVSPASDAVMSLAMDTGQVQWVTQTTRGDAWTAACLATNPVFRAGCPESEGPDFDYGSAVVRAISAEGEPILLAGQKSGILYQLNPETGEVQWQTRVADGGVLGGIEWGIATDGQVVYASLSDALEKAPGEAGGVAAVRVGDGSIVWEAPPFQDTCGTRARCHTGQPGAVTAIPGVIFSGSLDGHIRAHETATGRVIWDVDTVREFDTVNGVPGRGGSLNGPGATVVDGTVYVSSGYSTLNFMPGNVLLAFAPAED